MTRQSFGVSGRKFSVSNQGDFTAISESCIYCVVKHTCVHNYSLSIIPCIGNGGTLGVNSGDAGDTSLNSKETASISVPSSILDQIPTQKDDINLIFVVYNRTSLFPVRMHSQNTNGGNDTETSDLVIGTQVVSFSIPGLNEGTELSKPVNISLRLVNPVTGTLEVQCMYIMLYYLYWLFVEYF